MDSHGLITPIILIIIFLIFSAFFSATETAFTSLNRVRLKNRANDGDIKAKRTLHLAENYGKLLSTILIGNNLVNIALTATATVLFIKLYGAYGATISTVATTVVVLILGEISPKNLAKEAPEKVAIFSTTLIELFMLLFAPLNWIFGKWKIILSKMFRISGDDGITEEEILTMVEEAETEGRIEADQSELIQNAIEFNDLEAWDVITPRVDIVAIDVDSTKKDAAKIFAETGFSRVPVYDGDLDRILGVLNQKDFHNYIDGTKKTISDFIKPVVYVAGSMKAAVLLKRLQVNKSHMAIIVDEYGGTAGLVTMEDIIEELIGDIYDEHDEVESSDITLLQDGSYRVMCNANVEKVFAYFAQEPKLDVNTVNGWVVLQLDKLPVAGDEFFYETDEKIFKGKVTKADDKKAIEINLKVENKEEFDN
ncbi:HlyC/CorC family transporter [Eubacteriales bacterium KG127]